MCETACFPEINFHSLPEASCNLNFSFFSTKSLTAIVPGLQTHGKQSRQLQIRFEQFLGFFICKQRSRAESDRTDVCRSRGRRHARERCRGLNFVKT